MNTSYEYVSLSLSLSLSLSPATRHLSGFSELRRRQQQQQPGQVDFVKPVNWRVGDEMFQPKHMIHAAMSKLSLSLSLPLSLTTLAEWN